MQNTVYVFNLHNLNFKEVSQLLQEEKAFQFTKPQGGKIQSDTKSDFITVCVAMNNRYKKDDKYQERKKGSADSGGRFRRDWTDCVAQRRKQGLICLGNVHTHERQKNLLPKQHDCEGEGK